MMDSTRTGVATSEIVAVNQEHGSGGVLTRQLIEQLLVPALRDRHGGSLDDSTIVRLGSETLAFTTDSFVVDPIFFGGGDIGKLAVCGTVNDLAVSGATPLYLSLALIIEEGFPYSDLQQIMGSVEQAAAEANVLIATGDTKVVPKSMADKIFINTSGIGILTKNQYRPSLAQIQEGDDLIISGLIGNHAINLLSIKHGLGYDSRVLSDCAPMNALTAEVLARFGADVRYMRDLTRGGLGSITNEIATDARKDIVIDLETVPIQKETEMACDMLGLDPMYLANEGCVCIICSPNVSRGLVGLLRDHPYGRHAARIGVVRSAEDVNAPKVLSTDGRLIEHLVGLQLPRLC